MYQNDPPKPKRNTRPKHSHAEVQVPIGEIVQAAYKKFARSKSAREAMKQCLDEYSPKANGRVVP
jgi:hypothetical protein